MSDVVYLAGPINGCTDDEAHGWRQGFMDANPGLTYLDPMRRDYRGMEDENVTDIVEGDLTDIVDCDIVLAYCGRPSWGTAMEIFYAKSLGKHVICVVPGDEDTRISPWLRYHADEIVGSLSDVDLW